MNNTYANPAEDYGFKATDKAVCAFVLAVATHDVHFNELNLPTDTRISTVQIKELFNVVNKMPELEKFDYLRLCKVSNYFANRYTEHDIKRYKNKFMPYETPEAEPAVCVQMSNKLCSPRVCAEKCKDMSHRAFMRKMSEARANGKIDQTYYKVAIAYHVIVTA